MRRINMETWSRREHFNIFSTWDFPHFSMCANVDLTSLYPYLKLHGISFNVAVVYLISRTANDIPEFRYRIREGEVIEHEVVHPGTTILIDEELFAFCYFNYVEQFPEFNSQAGERIAYYKEHQTLKDPPGKDDLLFMTAIPWVSFTSFMHPMHLSPADSIPRFAWGKFYQEGESIKMPLSVQGHHAVMDGLHIGRYYEKIQAYFDQPESVLAL